MISSPRSAMMQGIQKVHGAAVPFVSMFYGTASTYLWEDDEGTTHKIVQIEGGEQGDTMMPPPSCLWVNIPHWKKCKPKCFLVSSCSRTWTTYMSSIRQNASRCSRTHSGESQESGQDQDLESGWGETCSVMFWSTWLASQTQQRAFGEVPTARQGMKVLGTPLGHRDFVRTHLEGTTADHQFLMDRIPLMGDQQSSWLLLVHCAAARANYMSRVVEPDATQEEVFLHLHKSRSHNHAT